MAVYTGVADSNGDFNIPFSINYASGQKVTVTAEKDSATKSIELYAPSEVAGGGVIQFSGDMSNFPLNIGNVTLSSEISGAIGNNAFNAGNTLFAQATGLTILGSVTSIGLNAFYGWSKSKFLILPESISSISGGAFGQWTESTSLVLPSGITSIPDLCFNNWRALEEILIPDLVTSIGQQAFRSCISAIKLTLPASLILIGSESFRDLTACNEIICKAVSPPTITSNTFTGLKATCIIKVPAASVAAYQAAANWSVFASRIQAI